METQNQTLIFPPQFFWGCATSAHQIEGGLINDWSEWEKSPTRLAELAKKQLDPQDFISGAAADSYVNNNADIYCLKELGVNAYRFSVDWSRIEPEEGKFNEEALAHYLEFIKKLRANKIEPLVTLWHWPLPLWLKDRGGWENKYTIKAFGGFVKQVTTYLNSEVNFWITLNEPLVYTSQSYLAGEWPPQKKNPLAAWRVINNLAAAHQLAYGIIKNIDNDNQVGIAKHNIYFAAANNSLINRVLKYGADWWWNFRFLDKLKGYQDFIGLNYYFHNLINYGFGRSYHYDKHSDLQWGLYPEGIYYLLKDLKKYNLPIYITENGLADKGDQHRSWYIQEILRSTLRAINEGVMVKGYFHWSLIDNFEWSHGFAPRFGLYEVNYQTFERVARPSAQFYADICRNNRI
ncbi:MAG: family 1 glycosylhydrolase [Patescibacteria group bacterium]